MKACLHQRRIFLLLICFLVLQQASFSQQDFKWQTDGTVNATVIKNDTLYVGGKFNYIGPYYGTCIMTDDIAGTRNAAWPVFDAAVRIIVPDGSGGYYVGGDFTKVNSVTKNKLVHLYSNFSIDMGWSPNVNGDVRAIFATSTAVYLGGFFTTVGGQSRRYIAAVDKLSGTPTAWNPIITGSSPLVKTIQVNGSTIYFGGNFNSVNGQTRFGLAAVDLSGAVETWNPNLINASPGTGGIDCLLLSGSTIYASGSFTNLGGEPRQYIAQLDLVTGNATAWNPNANSPALSMWQSGTTLYVGGLFNNIGGETRSKIAAISTLSGAPLPFIANANGNVNSIYPMGGKLYAAGLFTTVNGISRNKVVCLDGTTGAVDPTWNANAGNGFQLNSIAAGLGKVVFGGDITSINGRNVSNLAAIDLRTNLLTSWSPTTDRDVFSICPTTDNEFCIGGIFTTVNGSSRSRLAKVGLAGNLTSWDPGASDTVYTLAESPTGNIIYAGGAFTTAGGTSRNRLAAINASGTGTATGWNPNAESRVRTIYVSPTDGTVYAGGDFISMSGQTRNRLAAIDASGFLTTWDPNADNVVRAIDFNYGRFFIGGDFRNVGGIARNYVAAINTSGTVTSWTPVINNKVFALKVVHTWVYVAGDFTIVSGFPKTRVAALDMTQDINNLIAAWTSVGPGTTVNTLDIYHDRMFIGGGYSSSGSYRNYFLTFLTSGQWTLPNRILQFSAFKRDRNATLSWSLSDVPSGTRLELQRASANGEFATINSRPVQQDAPSFRDEFTDRNLPNGIHQYRLKINPPSGDFNTSQVRMITIDNKTKIFPGIINSNHSVLVNVPQQAVSFHLYNRTGQVCFTQALRAGSQSVTIPGLTPGEVYYYTIKDHYEQPVESGKVLVR